VKTGMLEPLIIRYNTVISHTAADQVKGSDLHQAVTEATEALLLLSQTWRSLSPSRLQGQIDPMNLPYVVKALAAIMRCQL